MIYLHPCRTVWYGIWSYPSYAGPLGHAWYCVIWYIKLHLWDPWPLACRNRTLKTTQVEEWGRLTGQELFRSLCLSFTPLMHVTKVIEFVWRWVIFWSYVLSPSLSSGGCRFLQSVCAHLYVHIIGWDCIVWKRGLFSVYILKVDALLLVPFRFPSTFGSIDLVVYVSGSQMPSAHFLSVCIS